MLDVRAVAAHFDDEAVLIAIADFFGAMTDEHAVADLTRPLAIPPGCSEAAAAACRTLNAFLERTRATLHELCRVSNDVSCGAAENTFLLARIAAATEVANRM